MSELTSLSTASICSWVASPLTQLADEEDGGHMKTLTSTLSYQAPFMVEIWSWSRAEEPTKSRDTNETRMTEMVIAILRLRPLKVSDRIKRSRIVVLLQRSEP